MGITYGSYAFNEPVPGGLWSPPYLAGLYAILFPDQAITPRPFAVVYFGESGNMSERGFLRSHEKFPCWIRQAGSESNLYIAVYLMPNSTVDQRRAIEAELINQYKPNCNSQSLGLGKSFWKWAVAFRSKVRHYLQIFLVFPYRAVAGLRHDVAFLYQVRHWRNYASSLSYLVIPVDTGSPNSSKGTGEPPYPWYGSSKG